MGLEDQKEVMADDGRVWRRSSEANEPLLAFISTGVLTFIFVVIVLVSGGDARFIALLPALVLLTVSILNFELSCFLLVTSLFVDLYFSVLSFGVWFTLPFGLSFLLQHRDIEWKEFSNPLAIPLLFYGVCILPSFLNVAKPMLSFFMLFNVVAFLIVMYSLVAGLRKYEDVQRIAIIYLGWVLVDSLYVIALGLSGDNRPFGFAGIWFVDYSALGVCLAIAIALVSQGSTRILALIVSFVIAAALVLTQTRSTWMSAVITLGVLVIYLFWHPELLGFTRRRVLFPIATGAVMMIGVVILVLNTNPRIEKRAVQITKQSGYGIDQQGNVENSLGSRLLIWDTAINAFRAHPIVGIGVYAFRFSSRSYSRLPRLLYDVYVSKLPTHQTHLAVLSETGILGFIGFLTFLIATLKYSFQSVKSARDGRTKRYALVALTCVIYCSVSMFITDAWLSGQQIVLLGLVVGSMLAVRKIGSSQKAENA